MDQENRHGYGTLVENLPMAFAYHKMFMDSQGKPVDYIFLDVNPAFEAMTGLRRGEILGKRVTRVLPGIKNSDFDWIGVYGRVALSGQSVRFEQYSKVLDRWYEVTAYSDEPGFFAAIFHDITGRRRMEKALEMSHKLYKSIVEDQTELICRFRPDGVLTFVNQAYCRCFDKTPDELVGQTFLALIPEEDQHTVAEHHARISPQQPSVTYEHRAILPGGKIAWQQWVDRAFFDEQGGIIEFQAVGRDITALKNQEFYRDLVESHNDVVFATDEKGVITYMSPSIEPITGHKPERFVGCNFSQLIYSEDIPCPREAFLRDLLSGRRKLHEFRIPTNEDRMVWIRGSFKAVQKDERIAGLREILTDRTELRRLRLHFERAQRMEVTGRFAAAMAHEMNNLMTMITSYCRFLLDSLPENNPLRSDVIKLREAGEKAAMIMKQLLAFGREQPFRSISLNINDMLMEVLNFLGPLMGREIEIEARLDPEIGLIEMDRRHLEQAIINLVMNAKDAMPEGGKLVIETANLQTGQPTASGLPADVPGSYVMLKVSDTGMGMDQETLSRAFEPFFSTKEPDRGTGLGLSSVHDTISQANGHISAESRPGKGAIFRICFPRIDA